MKSKKEPNQLKRGKQFHKEVQAEWEKTAEGKVKPERTIVKPNGRRGRVDIFVDDEDPDGVIAIVEIKATNWDIMKEKNVKRNIRRQIRQVWSYIESQIMSGKYVEGSLHKDVCPGIIFSTTPQDIQRKELIESSYEEEGITVVWHDEK